MDEASQQQGPRAATPGAPGAPTGGHPLIPVGNGRVGGPGYTTGAPGASYEEEQGAHVVREVTEEEAARAAAGARAAATKALVSALASLLLQKMRWRSKAARDQGGVWELHSCGGEGHCCTSDGHSCVI